MTVLNRSMFAAGGNVSKFPDLSGDGQVTQKDILMGRGVIERQAGGPVPQMAPAPVPPQMAPAPVSSQMEDQINAVEQQAAMGGEQAGLEYLAGTMEGIDAAQNFEEVINAMRGNAAPMQERRMELAGFVGDEDAYRTPDSVVAMVQPTIMLTEEGAMDSGIGQLMQALSDDVAMMGPEGQPTPVGQGVGELLMQGQPEPMPPMPQEMMMAFNGGPVVKKYADGDPEGVTKQVTAQDLRNYFTTQLLAQGMGGTQPDQIDTLYESYLPDLQRILGDTDELRKQREGLRMAEAGFQLATGRDKSGKNISGQPLLSQVGSAFQTFAGGRAKDLEADRTRDLAIRTMAYKQAADQQKFQRETKSSLNQALLGAAAKNLFDPGKYSISTIANADGSETPVRIDERTGAVTALPLNAVRQDVLSFASGKKGDFIRVFGRNSPDYGSGRMSADDVDVFEQGLSTYLNPITKAGGLSEFENALPKSVAINILQRLQGEFPTNLDQRIINEAQRVAALKPDESFFEASDSITDDETLLIKEGMTFEQSFDALSSVKGGLNNMIIYGSSLINMRPDIINKARIANEQALVTLLNRVKRTFRADLVGKPFASDAESLIQEVEPLDPNTLFTNSEKAYAVADSMQTILRKMMKDRDRILNNPKASETDRAAAEKMEGRLEWMEQNFKNLLRGFVRIHGDTTRTQATLNINTPASSVITDEDVVPL